MRKTEIELNKLARYRLSELVPERLSEYPTTWNMGKDELIKLLIDNEIDKQLDIEKVVKFCTNEDNKWQPIPINL